MPMISLYASIPKTDISGNQITSIIDIDALIDVVEEDISRFGITFSEKFSDSS